MVIAVRVGIVCWFGRDSVHGCRGLHRRPLSPRPRHRHARQRLLVTTLSNLIVFAENVSEILRNETSLRYPAIKLARFIN